MTDYLLDTNVLSEVLKRRASPAVVLRIRAVAASGLFTSAVSVMELRYGAARHPAGTALWERIERDVLSRVGVIPFGDGEGRRAGEILAGLERQGRSIGVEDVLIAATAMAHGLTLATRNERHLSRVPGLRVENWWT